MDGVVFVEKMAVVLANHFQVFVSEQFPEIFELVGMLPDEVGCERVPQT